MNLKPETPLIKKLEIKRLEDECENLRLWRWRLTIAIELILITVLGACRWCRDSIQGQCEYGHSKRK